MPPTTIAGRYTVQRAVGHGGMGTVWLCRDEVLGRDVAVKQVGTMPGETTSDVNRALREARSSAALNHRNVVSVYDAVEDGDHNWLIMEYVPSRTLAEILATEGSISPERTAWIGAQAADGLAAAHARGTVHRDVKPGNILVTEDDFVKIMDFGISRTRGDAQLTQTGLVTGTPAYFSPEAARGEDTSTTTDVWALGATLYAAVEGHLLYPVKNNALAMLTSIATEQAPFPQRAGFLTEAINRMLDRDPLTRWSMEDAAQALHRQHRRHPAAPAGTPTATLTTPTPVPSPAPSPVPSPAPLAAAMPPGPQTQAFGDPPPTAERPRPVAPDDRRRPGWLLPVAVVLALAVLTVGGLALLQRGGAEGDPAATSATGDGPIVTSPSASRTPNDSASDSNSASDSASAGSESPSDTTPDTAPDTATPDSPASDAAPSTDTTSTVTDYYSLLPGDTRAAWNILSDDYRASTTYGAYQGFWRTISAVRVDGVAESGNQSVDVRLTYTSADGGTESETRRLYLVESDGGYQIDNDEVIG